MKVTLQARIREMQDGELRFVFHAVPTEKNGKPIAPKEPPNATAYYLRFTDGGKRTTKPVGQNFSEAVTALRNMQVSREFVKHGLDVPAGLTNGGRKTVADAHRDYIESYKILAGNKFRQSTLYNKDRAVTMFRKACPYITYVDQMTDNMQAVRDFLAWMQDTKNVPRRNYGDSNGTLRTRLIMVKNFFNVNGVKFPLAKKDYPVVAKKKPEVFSDAEINQLLSKATIDEADLIHFALSTGFRDDEIAHAEYDDVTAKGTINVQNKPQYDFFVKNGLPRPHDIKLPTYLLERLSDRRERNPEGTLIFPNGNGRPDTQLLERVRRAARRAGYTKVFGMHKFRKTFGTRIAEKRGIVNAQYLLGHADVNMTQKYLAFTGVEQHDAESLFENVTK
jgi:integrase